MAKNKPNPKLKRGLDFIKSNRRSQASLLDLKQDSQSHTAETDISLTHLDPSPWNARRYFHPEAIDQLAANIKNHGLLHAITVRPKSDRYEIVCGNRRFQAVKQLGWTQIRARVMPLDDDQAYQIALIDNLAREALSPYEETIGYIKLLALSLDMAETELPSVLQHIWYEVRRQPEAQWSSQTQQVLSLFDTIGILSFQSFVIHRLPLLKLPQDLLDAVNRGEIHYTKARLLAKVSDAEKRQQLLDETIRDHLSVRAIRNRIRDLVQGERSSTLRQTTDHAAALVKRLQNIRDLPSDTLSQLQQHLKALERLLDQNKEA